MSHYHLEIIMPCVDDVPEAVTSILQPFDENDDEADHAFWDYWVIGGRWAGNKAHAHLDPDMLKAFYAWMTAENVKAQGITCGEQGLANLATVQKVDAKWRELFPGNGEHCTLFAHFNDQYSSGDALPGDICRLDEMSEGVTAAHVIVAGPSYSEGAALEARFMNQVRIWNGVDYVKTAWDGNVASAVQEYRSNFSDRCTAEHRELHYPKPDWIVVTVDYHS